MALEHRVRWWRPLAVGVAAVAIAGCGDGDSTSSTRAGVDEPVRIVVLGSSTAWGVGPRDRGNIWVNRYRVHLQSLNPENEVVNLAVPGFSTYEVLPTGSERPPGRPASDLQHNLTMALAAEPSAIIVNLPTNDVARGYSTDEQMRNYRALRDEAGAAGVVVWFTTAQPRNFDAGGLRALQELRRAMRRELGSRLLDFWTGIAAADGSILPEYDSGDHIHLNDAAHAILADRVIESALLGTIELAARSSREKPQKAQDGSLGRASARPALLVPFYGGKQSTSRVVPGVPDGRRTTDYTD